MGISPLSNSRYDGLAPLVVEKVKKQNLPNPNPYNYQVLMYTQIDKNLVIKVRYPDCTNYEGEKILLFSKCSYSELMTQQSIDPHFSESKKKRSPVARFEPTERGWKMARIMAKMLYEI